MISKKNQRQRKDKITSKKIAEDAGVSIVPGHVGIIKSAAEAIKISDQIGYPVMIKASAGGGGKGMRIAHNKTEVKEGFDRAKSEAKSSFGDEEIPNPKPIMDTSTSIAEIVAVRKHLIPFLPNNTLSGNNAISATTN